MKQIEVNYDNLDLAQRILNNLNSDKSVFKNITCYIIDYAMDKHVGIDKIDEIKTKLKEIYYVLGVE